MEQDPVCGMNLSSIYECEASKFNGVIYYFCCADCKKEFDADPYNYIKRLTSQNNTVNKIIEWERDPVCGEMIKIKDAKAMNIYKGTKYYFCCPICKKVFDKNPFEYADKEERIDYPNNLDEFPDGRFRIL